jgi:hypothetical protein
MLTVTESAPQNEAVTRAQAWVKAAIAYGYDPRIVFAEKGYWFHTSEPYPPESDFDPGMPPAGLKAEIRSVLEALGRTSRLQQHTGENDESAQA